MRKIDPFASPKRRLARAKQHINRLGKRIQTFFKKHPAVSTIEVDPDGFNVHCIKFARDFPDSWTDSAVEAIEALRSTLDQCGYAAGVLGGITNPKKAYFPFGDTPTELDNNVAGRCKDLRPEISALFRSFDSHERGNYALWVLNKLCNANKHRLLIPVGVSAGMHLHSGEISGTGGIGVRWERDKNRITFARIAPGSHFKYDANIAFHIAFDQFNGVKGGPAVGILNATAREVQRVLLATEAECRRIGIIT